MEEGFKKIDDRDEPDEQESIQVSFGGSNPSVYLTAR